MPTIRADLWSELSLDLFVLDFMALGSILDSGDICSNCFSCISDVLLTPGGGDVLIGGGGEGPRDMTGVAIGSLLAIRSAMSLIL